MIQEVVLRAFRARWMISDAFASSLGRAGDVARESRTVFALEIYTAFLVFRSPNKKTNRKSARARKTHLLTRFLFFPSFNNDTVYEQNDRRRRR